MAEASMSAQHYVGCDNCEENPAKFLCKACEGRLCEHVKSIMKRKKLLEIMRYCYCLQKMKTCWIFFCVLTMQRRS